MDSDGRPGDDSSWASGISANGRWELMLSLASNLVRHDTNRVEDAFIRDVRTRTTTRVSVSHTEEQADNLTEEASISRDGPYVAFTSYADDLDPHVDDGPDVFFRDVKKGWTRLVSASLEREPGNAGSMHPAGSAIGGAAIGTGDMVVAVAVFTVIGACSVAAPVIGYPWRRSGCVRPSTSSGCGSRPTTPP
jgi:hypothetical protein